MTFIAVPTPHAVVIDATLHVLYVAGGNIRSVAFGINAGSLTRLSGSDIDVDQPDSGNLLCAYVNDDQSKLWVRTSTTRTGVTFGNWRGFSIDNQGALARSAADDFNVASPFSGSQDVKGFWRVGDYIYYNRTPSGSGNTVVRRWRISTRTSDAATVDLGGRFAFERAMFGFGSHVFTQSTFTNDSGVPGGSRWEMRAVRVAGDFLEWDAPAADYATLNARRQANAGFRVAVMDGDIIGVSVPGAEFVPTQVDVRSVRRITLNGTREDLGDGETWRFDVARQKLIQDPGATALTAADALVVDYAARAIAQACNPGAAVMRDDFADLRDSEGLAFDDALETAEAFLDRYGTLTDRLSIEIRDHAESAREAETVQFDTAMLRALGLTDAADSDRWLIYDVQFRWDGDIRIQRAECQRGEFRERSVDWWRERDGDA